MGWEKILSEDDCFTANKIIDDICTIILESNYENHCPSLLGDGYASSSIFFAYLSKKRPVKEITINLLKKSLNSIASPYWSTNYSFCNGLFGVGWAFSHLLKEKLIDIEIGKTLNQLDQVFFEETIKHFDNNYYDYLHGGIGGGLYFLEREQNKLMSEYINDIFKSITKIAYIDGDTSSWKYKNFEFEEMSDKEKALKYNYSLGLSHGMPSILVFLAKLYEKNNNKEIKSLLLKTYKWVISKKMKSNEISIFPSLIETNTNITHPSRLAWCYGDLGISLSLIQISIILDDQNIRKEAISIALETINRRNVENTFVIDASFCHGSVGVAHCYSRLYHFTKMNEFKDASIFWYRETFKMRTENNGTTAFRFYGGEKLGWISNNMGILEGLAGIGLSLLSAANNIEPNWDRSLLLS